MTDEASPQPIRGAQVTLSRKDAIEGDHARTTTTDDAGRFSFESLPAGTYLLDATKLSLLSTSFSSARDASRVQSSCFRTWSQPRASRSGCFEAP